MVPGVEVIANILVQIAVTFGVEGFKGAVALVGARRRGVAAVESADGSVSSSSQELANLDLGHLDDVLERVAALEQNQRDERAANVLMVLERTVETLTDTDTPGETPDSRWVSAFVEGSQHASTDELRDRWARVLAGETQRPGSISVRTLNVLNDLDRHTAQMFRRICSMALQIENRHGIIVESHIPYLIDTYHPNALGRVGVSSGNLRLLVDVGLVSSEMSVGINYLSCVSSLFSDAPTPFASAWLVYRGTNWDLMADRQRSPVEPLNAVGAVLTKTGTELAQVVEKEATPDYEADLRRFFESNGVAMTERFNAS